ncbi:hypothetical protein ACQP2K_11290 [Microbispora siamensis]
MRATFPPLVRARSRAGRPAGVPQAGHAMTNAGVLAGFAQEARS